jgi:hypothetical protein
MSAWERRMKDRYDVFISYSHEDSDWVWKVLLPRLETVGLQVCIDKRDFVTGINARDNMAEAVRRSRCTVPVVTQRWVDSRYSGFETLLAGKVLPLVLSACNLPSEIKNLTYADLCDMSTRDAQLDKLVGDIKQVAASSQDAAPPGPSPSSGPLHELLESVCKGVDNLGDYKDIHDQFHQMQERCLDCLTRNLDRLPAGDENSWEEVTVSSEAMVEIAGELKVIGSKLASNYVTWLNTVETDRQIAE